MYGWAWCMYGLLAYLAWPGRVMLLAWGATLLYALYLYPAAMYSGCRN